MEKLVLRQFTAQCIQALIVIIMLICHCWDLVPHQDVKVVWDAHSCRLIGLLIYSHFHHCLCFCTHARCIPQPPAANQPNPLTSLVPCNTCPLLGVTYSGKRVKGYWWSLPDLRQYLNCMQLLTTPCNKVKNVLAGSLCRRSSSLFNVTRHSQSNPLPAKEVTRGSACRACFASTVCFCNNHLSNFQLRK